MSAPSSGGEEAVAPRVPPVPSKPTQAEQDEHHATGHAACRSWCEHCVRGRGRVSPHVSVPEGELPEVGVDYAFMGPEGSHAWQRRRCQRRALMPVLAFFAGWLRGLGCKRLLLRSDNERALPAFLRTVAASLEGVEVIQQASPEGDHAANGLAEVGVREVKAQTRVLKSHLGERLMRQLDWSEPLATWLVRHSANCLSRYRIQADGKTPDQRRTRKRWRRQAVEFGETAAFLPVAARREGRVVGDAERMTDGIFVGSWAHWHHCSSERGVFTSGAEDRGPAMGQRVHPEFRGLTGEEPEPGPPVPAVVMPAPEAIVRAPQQRRRYILKQDVARYGPTPGCEACVALAGGAHSE